MSTERTTGAGDGTAAQNRVPRVPDLINRILAGRYELLEMLGEGPLLAAYRSRDRVANRLVTVKVILPGFSERIDILNDLKAGLSQTLALNHPNIARAFDVGTDEETGLLFLAEEFVRGIDLKERIRRVAPFQLSAAAETAIAITEALEAAHARGIAHGDIRPQNVLIAPDGLVKVTGFGIANAQTRVVIEDSQLLGRVVGYIAPDSARAAAPTTSGDLYAVGVVLYEMLTGDMPFSGDTAVQVAIKHAQDPVPLARNLNAGVPVALDGIVQKAMGKTPSMRYANAGELLKDLRAVRDALRYGKPLNWLPGEQTPEAIPAAATPTPPASSTTPAPPSNVLSKATLPSPGATSGLNSVDAAGPTVVMPGRDVKKNKQAEAVMYEEETQPRRSGGVGRWLTFINLLLCFVLLGAVAWGIFTLLPYLQPAGEVVVPEMVGKKLPDAETLAIDKKFKLEIVAREFREKEARDVIYQQNIVAGRRIKEGKAIGIWVSKGPRMVEMPDVKGMSFEKARRLIESRGLVAGTVKYEYDPIEAKGNVIRQSPLPGENVARGTKIELILSKGEDPQLSPGYEPPTETNVAATPEPTPEASPTPAARTRYFRVEYPVPDDGNEHRIRIDVEDDEGPHTVYDETVKAGTKLKRERVKTVGEDVKVKVFDNDELASELVNEKQP